MMKRGFVAAGLALLLSAPASAQSTSELAGRKYEELLKLERGPRVETKYSRVSRYCYDHFGCRFTHIADFPGGETLSFRRDFYARSLTTEIKDRDITVKFSDIGADGPGWGDTLFIRYSSASTISQVTLNFEKDGEYRILGQIDGPGHFQDGEIETSELTEPMKKRLEPFLDAFAIEVDANYRSILSWESGHPEPVDLDPYREFVQDYSDVIATLGEGKSPGTLRLWSVYQTLKELLPE